MVKQSSSLCKVVSDLRDVCVTQTDAKLNSKETKQLCFGSRTACMVK